MAGPNRKWHSAVDVSGGESKVWYCKEQYCIGSYNVRSMNQGKLDLVKQERVRVNTNILGISELKWTGMGVFNWEVLWRIIKLLTLPATGRCLEMDVNTSCNLLNFETRKFTSRHIGEGEGPTFGDTMRKYVNSTSESMCPCHFKGLPLWHTSETCLAMSIFSYTCFWNQPSWGTASKPGLLLKKPRTLLLSL